MKWYFENRKNHKTDNNNNSKTKPKIQMWMEGKECVYRSLFPKRNYFENDVQYTDSNQT